MRRFIGVVVPLMSAMACLCQVACTDCSTASNQTKCQDSVLLTLVSPMAPSADASSGGASSSAANDSASTVGTADDSGVTPGDSDATLPNPPGPAAPAGDAAMCSSGAWEALDASGMADAYGGLCSSSYAACGDASAGITVYANDFETSPYAGISGTWEVDNSQAQGGSTQSIHPPQEGDGGLADMSMSCGGSSHSELSFWYMGLLPTSDQQLNFYVDDVLYTTYGNTYNIDFDAITWVNVQVIVPTGPHQYRWEATAGAGGQPPYWVDTIACIDTPAVANTTEVFDFDEGFVPLEFGGNFRIDNSDSQAGQYQTGMFAAHPPILTSGQTASMYFSCGCRSHSKLTFYYNGVLPAADQQLNFYVDDSLYATYGNTYNIDFDAPTWTNVAIAVPNGTHQYRWDVTTATTDGEPPYWLDAIQCQ